MSDLRKLRSFRYLGKRIALFEGTAEDSCADCPADSGAAVEHRVAVSSYRKAVSVLYWETKSGRYRLNMKKSTWKTVPQAMVGIVARDRQYPA
jgi:hypothetical protein